MRKAEGINIRRHLSSRVSYGSLPNRARPAQLLSALFTCSDYRAGATVRNQIAPGHRPFSLPSKSRKRIRRYPPGHAVIQFNPQRIRKRRLDDTSIDSQDTGLYSFGGGG